MSDQPEVPHLPTEEVEQSFTEAEILAQAAADVAALPQPSDAAPTIDATTAAMLRIAMSMETMMSRQEAVRQIPFNEVKPVTPWNPEGKTDRIGFSRTTYMHGIMLNPMTHTEETLRLFNQLKPGRYIDRKVEVQRGNDGSINIQWPGVRIDQRIEFYGRFNHIDVLLQAILDERKAKEDRRKLGILDDDEED